MTVRLSIGDRAEVHVREIDRWWVANRPSAPNLFHDEFLASLGLLRSAPEIGQPQRHRRLHGLRRLSLPSTQYHVYYLHDPQDNDVLILAVWSALRGHRPPLVSPAKS